MPLHVHALGHAHPETEIDNAFLESLDIGTSDAWIRARTGIRSRRSVLPRSYLRDTRNRDPRAAAGAARESGADLAARAARLALARAGLEPRQLGLVLCGSSAPDTQAPAQACNAARLLGLEVPALDVASACTSLFAQLHLLAGMRPEALPDFVLLLAPEAMTTTVDYSDRASCVLWGDAAAAVVVSARVPGRARVCATHLESDPAGAPKVVVPRAGHFSQEGQAVQRFAIARTARSVERLRAARGEDAGRALHFVGHQANLRMLEAVCRRAGVPAARHHHNVVDYGNTGAASAASVLSMRWEKWEDTDDVAVAGVGAGLTWGGFLLRFGRPGGPVRAAGEPG